MKALPHRLCLAGVILWALLGIPALRHPLESSMTLQMLVQIPLLVLAGVWLAQGTPGWLDRRLAAWNHQGITGLLLASLTSLVWMLPLALDAALDDPRFTLAKFLSVPLLIGVPVALSWPRAGFVVRGVVLLELSATAFRLGWLYLVSPVRLCSNYLLDDQEQVGRILLAIGLALVLMLAWKLMWGHIDPQPGSHGDSRTLHG